MSYFANHFQKLVDDTPGGVLQQAHQVGFAGLLQGHHGGTLEPQVGFEVLGDLMDQTLEGQLADQQLSGLWYLQISLSTMVLGLWPWIAAEAGRCQQMFFFDWPQMTP